MALRHAIRPVGTTQIIRTRPAPAPGAGVWQHSLHPGVEVLEGRIVLATLPASLASDPGGGATSPLGLTPAQVAHLYGFDDIFFQGGIAADGSGATIAIVDPYSDPDITKDLTQFDQAFGLPAPRQFTIDTPLGTPQQAPPPDAEGSSWGAETALDVEWARLSPGGIDPASGGSWWDDQPDCART